MAGLPKGLLKEVIEEGYDPPEAMKEAWRRVKLQKKRYAARLSYGGGYPLGYTGRNKPRKRKPHKIPFGQWVKAVETEFDLAEIHPKWSAFTARKLYKVYTPKKAAELLILASKRRKNPRQKKKGKKLRDLDSPTVLGYKLDRKTLVPIKKFIDIKTPGDYGADPLGNNLFKMVPSGDIVDLTERNKRLARKNPVTRKNPIAFYNPSMDKLIYGRVLEIKAVKTSGPHAGGRYSHKFGPHVQAVGLSNGWVLLKSTDRSRLWKEI